MYKKYLYCIALALLPVVVYFNTWQNIAVLAVILGYTAFLEVMDKQEEVKSFNKRISSLEENMALNNEKMTELRTKAGLSVVNKAINGR